MSSWLLGVIRSYALGIFIHILLVVALVVLLHPRYSGPQCDCITTVLTLPAGLPPSPARDFAPQHTKIAGNVYPANRLSDGYRHEAG